MAMPDSEWRRFAVGWREFERTLTRIIPRSIAIDDPDISEEITAVLDLRDRIEDGFLRHPDDPRLAEHRTKILPLDAELLLWRNDILNAWDLNEYRSWRERNSISRSHWWWYLDETSSETLQAARESLQRTLMTPVDREPQPTGSD